MRIRYWSSDVCSSDLVETVLKSWCDRIVLNLAQAVELHEGALAQIPHRDQDLWQAPRDGREYQVNVIWPLGAFTAENGETMLWPGSNRLGAHVEPTAEPADRKTTRRKSRS